MRKHQTDKRIFIATFILVLIGTIMVSIIGPSYTNIQNIAYGRNDDPNQTFKSQILYVALAFLVMIFFLKMPLSRLGTSGKKTHGWQSRIMRNLPEIMMWGSLAISLVMTLSAKFYKLPFVGCALGACRWLNLGFLQLQVAELVKFGALFYFAKICTECREAGGFERKTDERKIIARRPAGYTGLKNVMMQNSTNRNRGSDSTGKKMKKIMKDLRQRKDGYVFWVKFLVPLGAAVFFLVVAQKDLGSALPLVAIALAILLVSGAGIKSFLILVVCGLAFAGLAMVVSPHRQERLKGFLEGSSSNAYHINNALIAIGSGGLFGVGIGNNVQTAGYLPESITDSMFAVIGETIGFAGILVVLMFYYMLLSRILKVADCTRNSFYQLVTVGIFAWLAGHVVVNITAMTGLVPLTGITLPLLSKGGTSLILNMAIIGLVLNISQYTMRSDLTDAERRQRL